MDEPQRLGQMYLCTKNTKRTLADIGQETPKLSTASGESLGGVVVSRHPPVVSHFYLFSLLCTWKPGGHFRERFLTTARPLRLDTVLFGNNARSTNSPSVTELLKPDREESALNSFDIPLGSRILPT